MVKDEKVVTINTHSFPAKYGWFHDRHYNTNKEAAIN